MSKSYRAYILRFTITIANKEFRRLTGVQRSFTCFKDAVEIITPVENSNQSGSEVASMPQAFCLEDSSF